LIGLLSIMDNDATMAPREQARVSFDHLHDKADSPKVSGYAFALAVAEHAESESGRLCRAQGDDEGHIRRHHVSGNQLSGSGGGASVAALRRCACHRGGRP